MPYRTVSGMLVRFAEMLPCFMLDVKKRSMACYVLAPGRTLLFVYRPAFKVPLTLLTYVTTSTVLA